VTAVRSTGIDHTLIVRYDPTLTSRSVLIAAIDQVVVGVAR